MFKNLKELIATMPDEQQCREYMEKARWGDSPFCPHCNTTKPYKLNDGKSYRCSSKTCRKDFTVTVGTVFENSKVKLSTWLTAAYILGAHKKGISSVQLGKDLGVTQRTAWFINHRLRYAMGNLGDGKLEGIVEVDETHVGGKLENMNKGRRKKWQELGRDNKIKVMGMVERGGKARMAIIGNSSFKEVVRLHVAPTADLMTDSHVGYEGLGQEFSSHQAVNHSINEYKRGEACTNTVEGFFSLFKRTVIGTYHWISPKHLHRYCAETVHRFNIRDLTDKEKFERIISNVEGRLKYDTLVDKKEPREPRNFYPDLML